MGRPPTVGPKTKGALRTALCREKRDIREQQLAEEAMHFKRLFQEEQLRREEERTEHEAIIRRKDEELFEMKSELAEKRNMEMDLDQIEKNQQKLNSSILKEQCRLCRVSFRLLEFKRKQESFISSRKHGPEDIIAYLVQQNQSIDEIEQELYDQEMSVKQSKNLVKWMDADLERALGLPRNGLPAFVSRFFQFVDLMNDDSMDALVTDDGRLTTTPYDQEVAKEDEKTAKTGRNSKRSEEASKTNLVMGVL
uniref:DDRGK domain-containing protein 1 n=1 Tax=Steinernema glaseri TaxID=37863 RepID=A0A1I7ZGF7_9BILA